MTLINQAVAQVRAEKAGQPVTRMRLPELMRSPESKGLYGSDSLIS